MKSESPIVLVLAHYQLHDDAKTDLAAVKRFIVTRSVDLYDAVFIATDAWDQAHVSEWVTPILGSSGFLRTAFAAVYGGSPAARHRAYDRLPRRDLERIATSLDPDATALVVAVQTGYPDEFTACFAHASRVSRRGIVPPPGAGSLGFHTVLEELMAAA